MSGGNGVNGGNLNHKAQAAMSLLQGGRAAEAETVCRSILREDPRHFHALHLLGIVHLARGDSAAAVPWLRKAITVNPGEPAAHGNLAAALIATGQPAAALAACDEGLRLKAAFPEALANRGMAEVALGRPTEALASFNRSLALAPQLFDAHLGRGNALADLGRWQEALNAYGEALSIKRDVPVLLNAMARALLRLKRPEEALRGLDEALRLAPGFAEAHSNRGSALRVLQRPEEALASYRRALELRPADADVMSNVANLLLHRGREREALDWCDRALDVRPDLVEALNIRAQALRALNRAAEATAASARLLDIAPDFDYARGHRLYARAAVCDWTDHSAEVDAIVAGVAAGRRAATPMAFLSFCGDPALQLACARTFIADAVANVAAPGPIGRRARIRLAYVSADFNDHPVAHLLAGVLERHDRGRFEVYAVSIDPAPRDNPMRRRIAAAVDHFFDAHLESDLELATRLRGLEIDVAVDLNGHTRGGRPGLFALRPAPVQVNYLGYTGTSGAEFIDYVIGDAVALPATLDVAFTERIARLPCGFLPNDDRQPIAAATPTRAAVGLPPDGIVYCAFNNPYKINAAMFDAWMHIVRETPGSVLWLKGGEGALIENLRDEAARRGVDPARLLFAPRMAAMDEHLARYRLADLFLDSLPYGAHATARDALWAGLPVLTCAGEAFATRVAASLLIRLGLDDLVTRSPAEYVRRALELVRDPARLGALRDQLARERLLRPVFRTDRYTRDLETAYGRMVDLARSGEPPQSFAVPSAEPGEHAG